MKKYIAIAIKVAIIIARTRCFFTPLFGMMEESLIASSWSAPGDGNHPLAPEKDALGEEDESSEFASVFKSCRV